MLMVSVRVSLRHIEGSWGRTFRAGCDHPDALHRPPLQKVAGASSTF